MYEDVMEISRNKEKCVMNGSLFKVMPLIKEAYGNGDNTIAGKETLPIVAPKVTFKVIQKFITAIIHY